MDPFLGQVIIFGFAPRPAAQAAEHEDEIDFHAMIIPVKQTTSGR